MSEFNQEDFNQKELFLMREAIKAGQFYETLEEWLSEVISDAGHIVGEHLIYDALNLEEDELGRLKEKLSEVERIFKRQQRRIENLDARNAELMQCMIDGHEVWGQYLNTGGGSPIAHRDFVNQAQKFITEAQRLRQQADELKQ